MSESVKAPETKAPAKKTQAVTEAKTEAVLYVGPTISGIAITGTVYTTIPEAAKAAKADAPMILNLFIPIREYGEAERMIREKRGYVYSAYAEGKEIHRHQERERGIRIHKPILLSALAMRQSRRVHSRKICSGRSHDPVHGIR